MEDKDRLGAQGTMIVIVGFAVFLILSLSFISNRLKETEKETGGYKQAVEYTFKGEYFSAILELNSLPVNENTKYLRALCNCQSAIAAKDYEKAAAYWDEMHQYDFKLSFAQGLFVVRLEDELNDLKWNTVYGGKLDYWPDTDTPSGTSGSYSHNPANDYPYDEYDNVEDFLDDWGDYFGDDDEAIDSYYKYHD